MPFTKTVDYDNININHISFINYSNNDDPNNNFRLLYCRLDNNTFNIITPIIKFTSNFNKFIKPYAFCKAEFYIPIDGNADINIFKFLCKLNELKTFLVSNEIKTKYNIPLDYDFVDIFKNSNNPKYPIQLKTKLSNSNSVVMTNVYNSYSYKNNPNKIYKNKIDFNTASDIYDLITKNSHVKTKLQPFRLWINKTNKTYGLTFKTLEIEIINKQLIETANPYSYQFVLLDEEDINVEENNYI